jgi:hypothetical protein
MAFVMIAAGATSRSCVRTLPVRPLIALAGLASVALLVSGGALGYWIAEPAAKAAPAAAHATAATEPSLPSPFTLEQVGAISGRLFRLESEAAQLSKRIGTLAGEAAPERADRPRPVPRPAPSAVEPAGPSGGPLLPPRADAAGLDAIDAQMARVERQIASLAGAAAQQSIELMRFPSRLPIAGATLTSSFRSPTRTPSTPASTSPRASARRSPRRPAASSPSPAFVTTSAASSRSTTATA